MGCMHLLKEINYWAVGAGVVYSSVLGMIWYHPKVFFNTWAAEIGLKVSAPDRKKAMTGMQVMFITTIIQVFSLAAIIYMAPPVTLIMALHIGVFVSVGIAAATRLSETLFEQRSIKSWLIQSGYRALAILGCAAIIGLWK